MHKYRVKGLVAAVFTPMRPDGQINLDIIPEYAEYLMENKVSGVFVNGTTGEFPSLTISERKQLVEAWAANGKHGIPHLMVHVGCESLSDAKDLASHAETYSASAIGMISPYFFKPPTIGSLVEFSRQVASAAPKTPFYYYHIPPMTGVNFDMVEYIKLAEKLIPTFRGIKYSYLDLSQANQCLVYGQKKYNILFGVDQQLLAALAMGIDAAIGSTYNFMAPIYNELMEAYSSGDIEKTRYKMDQVQKIIDTAFRIGTPGVSALKLAMSELTPINVGPPRLPIPEGDEKVREELRIGLKELF